MPKQITSRENYYPYVSYVKVSGILGSMIFCIFLTHRTKPPPQNTVAAKKKIHFFSLLIQIFD
jgi:hypothetical protein